MRTNQLLEIRKQTPDTHYVVEETCSNCGERLFFTIPKGQSVCAYLEGHPLCEYCGCKLDAEPFRML